MKARTPPAPVAFQPPPKIHATLVGIDSDGCVFDSMGIKQRNHFVPFIIRWPGKVPARGVSNEMLHITPALGGQPAAQCLLLCFCASHDVAGLLLDALYLLELIKHPFARSVYFSQQRCQLCALGVTQPVVNIEQAARTLAELCVA